MPQLANHAEHAGRPTPTQAPPHTPPTGPAARARRDAGFTLTELLVSIFIIGLLATVVLVNVLPAMDSSRVEKARADVAALETALEQYRFDMAVYPTTEQGLAALVQAPAGAARAERYRSGGYVRRLPDDPWGNPYQYRAPGDEGRAFDLFSAGADGEPGGEDLNADIGNWR